MDSDRSSGTMLVVLGVILVVAGALTAPYAAWTALWRGYGGSGPMAIGLVVLVVVLLGLGIAALVVGKRFRAR